MSRASSAARSTRWANGEPEPSSAGSAGAADAEIAGKAPPPPSSSSSATVLVASPHRHIVRSLTAALLDLGIDRVVQVGSVERVDEVIAGGVIGDLALVSVSFGAPSARLIRGLCRIGWYRVIALIPDADAGTLAGALEAGATGILLDRDGRWSVLDPPADPPGVRALSDKERDVIRLVAEGQTNREIGRNLLLSSLTVKSHLARIGHKLGAGDRAQIAAIAMRAGVID